MDNYAHGRLPTKTRCGTATSAVNKQLTAPKPRAQPARAAFNPARMVNFDLRRVHYVRSQFRGSSFGA
jgi:hypothetical protein